MGQKNNPEVNILDAATEVLYQSCSENGFIASTEDRANYRRIWTRDGVIIGLTGLLHNDDRLISTFRKTLDSLAEYQGPNGEIPSNIPATPDNLSSSVSYGSIAGRVDTIPWFVIGVCNYAHITGDREFFQDHRHTMEKGLKLMRAWEFNDRGLLYMPMSGEWRDEMPFHGYILYVQVLRLWAHQCFQMLDGNSPDGRDAKFLKQVIHTNFWLENQSEIPKEVLHPKLYHSILQGQKKRHYWLLGFHPGGYFHAFDPLSNALAVLLDLGTLEQQQRILRYGDQIFSELPVYVLPAIWPPFETDSPEWQYIKNLSRGKVRNYPFQYHNGGLWPFIGGFWGLALQHHTRLKELERLYTDRGCGIGKGNTKENSFVIYEFLNGKTGEPGGVKNCAWSAAGILMLEAARDGKQLLMGVPEN